MVLSFSYLIPGVGLCHPCASLPALDILWFYDLRSVSGDTLELDRSLRLAAHLFLPCTETQTLIKGFGLYHIGVLCQCRNHKAGVHYLC